MKDKVINYEVYFRNDFGHCVAAAIYCYIGPGLKYEGLEFKTENEAVYEIKLDESVKGCVEARIFDIPPGQEGCITFKYSIIEALKESIRNEIYIAYSYKDTVDKEKAGKGAAIQKIVVEGPTPWGSAEETMDLITYKIYYINGPRLKAQGIKTALPENMDFVNAGPAGTYTPIVTAGAVTDVLWDMQELRKIYNGNENYVTLTVAAKEHPETVVIHNMGVGYESENQRAHEYIQEDSVHPVFVEWSVKVLPQEAENKISSAVYTYTLMANNCFNRDANIIVLCTESDGVIYLNSETAPCYSERINNGGDWIWQFSKISPGESIQIDVDFYVKGGEQINSSVGVATMVVIPLKDDGAEDLNNRFVGKLMIDIPVELYEKIPPVFGAGNQLSAI